MLKVTAYCLMICLPFNAATSIETELPILQVFPRCDYTVLQQFRLSAQRTTGSELEKASLDALRTEIIHTLRKKSAAIGAEAIILQEVASEKRIAKDSSRHKAGAIELQIRVRAEAIAICDEDASRPLQPTPFNERGHRNASLISTNIRVPIHFTLPSSEQTNLKMVLNPVISLRQGVHGIHLGMTDKEVTEVFGPADATFQLQQDYHALAYGKNYWLTLQGGKVISVETFNPLLSADITNQFNENENFAKLGWQLEGKFDRNSSLPQVRAHFQQSLTAITDNLFAVQQNDHQLRLNFVNYLDINSNQRALRLSQLSLLSVKHSPGLPPELAVALTPHAFSKIRPANPFNAQFWQQILQPLPTLNQVLLQNKRSMTIYHPLLAAVYENQRLKEIQLRPVYKAQTAENLEQMLAQLGMPLTKDAFLQQFPDAFDVQGKMMYYGDEVEVNALYSNNARQSVVSIILRFM